MTARRKLYYIPGIISLVGYVFLLPYACKKSQSSPVKAISFSAPMASSPSDQFALFTTNGILSSIRQKKKIRLQLDGDHAMNQKKLDIIRFEARRLKYTMDTTSVIFIELTQDIYYGELFRLYDNCIADKIQRFATWDHYFIIFGGYIPRPRSYTGFSFVCFDDVVNVSVPPKKSLLEKLIEIIKPFTLFQVSALVFLWFLMIVLSIYKFRACSKPRWGLMTPFQRQQLKANS